MFGKEVPYNACSRLKHLLTHLSKNWVCLEISFLMTNLEYLYTILHKTVIIAKWVHVKHALDITTVERKKLFTIL